MIRSVEPSFGGWTGKDERPPASDRGRFHARLAVNLAIAPGGSPPHIGDFPTLEQAAPDLAHRLVIAADCRCPTCGDRKWERRAGQENDDARGPEFLSDDRQSRITDLATGSPWMNGPRRLVSSHPSMEPAASAIRGN